MATANMSEFFRRLLRGMAAQTLGEHSDQQLVERAMTGRDEAAFQAIVNRHGPTVYRVCWRVVQHQQDAEDAFQATFLILAKKLRTLRKQASVASWLHGVAYRVAIKAKTQSAARRRHEAAAPHSETSPPDDVAWKDWRSVLDAELNALPDKWRLPLILCYLESCTQDEAADHLGWSKSTLRRRLDEGREALGRSLSRRGLMLPAALSAVLLSDCVASTAPAAGLVSSTLAGVVGIAAGKASASVISANVAALTDGVLKAMLLSKLRTTAIVVAFLMMLGVGTLTSGMLADFEPHGKTPAIQVVAQAKPEKAPNVNKQPAPQVEQPDDSKLLQGDWRIIEFEHEGVTDVGPKAAGQIKRITITHDAFLMLEDRSGEIKKSTFKLAAYHSPRWIDLTPEYGAFKGQQLAGIYALENGRLRICNIKRPDRKRDVKDRPKEFKTAAGDGLGVMTLERIDAAELKWDAEFQKVYALKDGEVLKRIATPYPECREKVFDEKGKGEQLPLDTDTTYMFYRYQNNRTVLAWSNYYGRLAPAKPPPASLAFILEGCLHLPLQHVVAPGNMLATNIEGELVFRSGTAPEQWVPALDKILQTECGLPMKLTLKEIEKDVTVLSGDYQFKPRKGRVKGVLDLTPGEPAKNWKGYGTGTFDEFVTFLNQFANRHIISEVSNPPKDRLSWWHPSNGTQTDATGRNTMTDAPESDVIFKLVVEQTGLTFTAAKRKVRVLAVEKTD